MRHLYLLPLFSLLVACSPPDRNERSLIASEMEASLNAVLDNWYPDPSTGIRAGFIPPLPTISSCRDRRIK